MHTRTHVHTHTYITKYTSTISSVCMLFVCYKVSLPWLPKHKLNMDNNSRHAEFLYKELQAPKECWEWERKPSSGKRKTINYPITNVSPVFLNKYKTTLCHISQVPLVLFISPDSLPFILLSHPSPKLKTPAFVFSSSFNSKPVLVSPSLELLLFSFLRSPFTLWVWKYPSLKIWS